MTSTPITDDPGTAGMFGHLAAPRETRLITASLPSGETFRLAKTTVGPMDNNAYFVCAGQDALLIDAAADAEHLLAVAEALGVRITDVLTTHRHDDHVQALSEVLAATGARHHASPQDAPALPAAVDRTWCADAASEPFVPASTAVAALSPTVTLLRGHTPGGLAVTVDGHVFTGDSLFPGGVANTGNPDDFARLIDDVTTRVFTLPDTTAVHPGHGDDTTLGAERSHLDEWKARGW